MGGSFGQAGVVTIPIKLLTKDLTPEFQKARKAVETQMGSLSKTLEKGGSALTKHITLPAIGAFGAAIKVGGDFQDSMTKSLAIMGKVSDTQRKKMEKAAKSVAKTTAFSAKQAADSYFFLASAGLDATQSIEAMPAVASFAAAGNFDLALATDLLTDSQSALGEVSQDAEENLRNMVRVSDVLVKANTLANASVEQFAEALTTKAAAAGRALGKEVEEITAVLAAFADQGKKGKIAGEGLSILLSQLPTLAKKNAAEFQKLGVEVFDSSGKMNNMADIVEGFEKALEGASDEQKIAILSQLGLTEALGDNIKMLLGTSEKIRTYEKGLKSAGGVTDEVAKKQLESFNAQMQIMRNKIELVGIELFEKMAPKLQSVFIPALDKTLNKMADFIIGWDDMDPSLQKQITSFGGLAIAIGPVLLIVAKMVGAVGSLAALMGGGMLVAVVALTSAAYLLWQNWDGVKAGFMELAGFLTGDGVGALTVFAEGWQIITHQVGGYIEDLAEKVGSKLQEMLDSIGNVMTAAKDKIVGTFASVYDIVVGNSIVPDMVDEVGAHFDRMTGLIAWPTEKAKEEVIRQFKEMNNATEEELRVFEENLNDTLNAFDTALAHKESVNPEISFMNQTADFQQSVELFPEMFTQEDINERIRMFWDQLGLEGQETLDMLTEKVVVFDEAIQQGFDQLKRIEEQKIARTKMVALLDKHAKAVERQRKLEEKAAEKTAEKWEKKQTILGGLEQLLSALPGKWKVLGKAAQVASKIVQIAASGMTGGMMAFQIAITLATEALGFLGEETEKELTGVDKFFDELKSQAESWADSLTDLLVELIETGTVSFEEFFAQILRDILNIGISTLLVEPLFRFLGGFFAKGDTFQGGRPQAFASGGIVNAPTAFGIGRRQLGIMGEAGPEAIMPLRRMADGGLGVAADGAGGGTIVQIVDQRGQDAPPIEVERSVDDGYEIIRAIVRAEVGQGIRQGEYDGIFGQRFGLNNRGV